MDRLKREANPPVGQLASPVPQYKRPGSTDYDPVEGQHGAPFATLKDASGNVVSPATEDKLEQVRQLLTGVATEAKLEQARVLLNTISNKDFATQATLEVVQSELALIKSELANIKANQLSGDQKVTLSGTKVLHVTFLNAVAFTTDASTNYSLRSLLNLSREQFAQIKSLTLNFYDTHDASGRVLLTAESALGSNFPGQYRIYENASFFTPGTNHRQLGNFPNITSDFMIDLPCLAGSKWTDLQLNIKFDTAPSSGALTITGIVEF